MLDRERIACYAAVMESGCVNGACFEVCLEESDEKIGE